MCSLKEKRKTVTLMLFPLLQLVSAQEDYSKPRRFVLNLQDLSWEEARSYCEGTGGHLAKLYDLATIPDLNLTWSFTGEDSSFWIGLSHWYGSDDWLWADNTSISWENWASNNDKMTSDNRRCALASGLYPFIWRSDSCFKRRHSLCQYPGESCTFIIYPNSRITGHNSMYMYEKTVEECKNTCRTSTTFFCVSFEHHQGDRLCQFNTGNRWTLPNFFANYEGWTYYHRTCNIGEVINSNLTLSSSTSRPLVEPSLSSSYVSSYYSSSSSFHQEPCSTSYAEINVTVTMTTTVYATVTMTRLFSLSVTNDSVDPIQELQEIQEVLKQRSKQLKKISYEDNRPSATYVGYVAITFLCGVFGSIILFDLLTLYRNKTTKKNKHAASKKYGVAESDTRKVNLQTRIQNETTLNEPNTTGENRIEQHSDSQSSNTVLDRTRNQHADFGLASSKFVDIYNQRTANTGQRQRQLWTKLWVLHKSKMENNNTARKEPTDGFTEF